MIEFRVGGLEGFITNDVEEVRGDSEMMWRGDAAEGHRERSIAGCGAMVLSRGPIC
jgi:hypothetical protein